jgi:hypothetical protein
MVPNIMLARRVPQNIRGAYRSSGTFSAPARISFPVERRCGPCCSSPAPARPGTRRAAKARFSCAVIIRILSGARIHNSIISSLVDYYCSCGLLPSLHSFLPVLFRRAVPSEDSGLPVPRCPSSSQPCPSFLFADGSPPPHSLRARRCTLPILSTATLPLPPPQPGLPGRTPL